MPCIFRQYEYDNRGLLTTFRPRAAATINFDHDAVARLLERTWVNGAASGVDTYSYDAAGRLTAAGSTNTTWPAGAALNQTYDHDNRGRLVEATQNGRTLEVEYDAAQRVSKLTYPGGMEVEYVYDLDGRVTQIKRDGNAIAVYTYDAAGRRATRALANGLTTSYTYDAAGQLLSVAVENQTPATVLEHSYTYDNVGQRETRTERLGPLGPWTDEYSYDNAGQLTGVDYGGAHPYAGPGGGNLNLASYDFDEVGNRETETRNAVPTAYVTDNVNRYTSVGGVAQTHSARGDLLHHNDFTLLYDADGHLISATRAAPAATQHYLYNALPRQRHCCNGLRRRRPDSAWPEQSEGNTMGRRAGVASSTGGAPVVEYHLHFGIHVIDAHQPVSGTTEQYIFEPGIDQPLAAVSPGTGSIRFFHQDALGSVVALTDATGTPIELYRYTAWGQPVVYSGAGTLQADGTQPQSRFMFTGREWNALTGLSHHRARQYSPSLGRWTGPDPIGEAGGLNLYAYVGNGATRWIDLFGLQPKDKRFGLGRDFWRWYHRQRKQPGDPDLEERGEAMPFYEEWEELGKPDPEGKRTLPEDESSDDCQEEDSEESASRQRVRHRQQHFPVDFHSIPYAGPAMGPQGYGPGTRNPTMFTPGARAAIGLGTATAYGGAAFGGAAISGGALPAASKAGGAAALPVARRVLCRP